MQECKQGRSDGHDPQQGVALNQEPRKEEVQGQQSLQAAAGRDTQQRMWSTVTSIGDVWTYAVPACSVGEVRCVGAAASCWGQYIINAARLDAIRLLASDQHTVPALLAKLNSKQPTCVKESVGSSCLTQPALASAAATTEAGSAPAAAKPPDTPSPCACTPLLHVTW